LKCFELKNFLFPKPVLASKRSCVTLCSESFNDILFTFSTGSWTIHGQRLAMHHQSRLAYAVSSRQLHLQGRSHGVAQGLLSNPSNEMGNPCESSRSEEKLNGGVSGLWAVGERLMFCETCRKRLPHLSTCCLPPPKCRRFGFSLYEIGHSSAGSFVRIYFCFWR